MLFLIKTISQGSAFLVLLVELLVIGNNFLSPNIPLIFSNYISQNIGTVREAKQKQKNFNCLLRIFQDQMSSQKRKREINHSI